MNDLLLYGLAYAVAGLLCVGAVALYEEIKKGKKR